VAISEPQVTHLGHKDPAIQFLIFFDFNLSFLLDLNQMKIEIESMDPFAPNE